MNIDYGKLAEELEVAITKALGDKSIDELKELDWFTWNTDFFIEQKNNKILNKAA